MGSEIRIHACFLAKILGFWIALALVALVQQFTDLRTLSAKPKSADTVTNETANASFQQRWTTVPSSCSDHRAMNVETTQNYN